MMIDIKKIKLFYNYNGLKYKNPDRFPNSKKEMEQIKLCGQEARKEFEKLTELFSNLLQNFQPEPISQWLNQAQIIRPSFWRYFIEEGHAKGDPSFAIRLYEQNNEIGVYVELSIIERKLNEDSLAKQNKVLREPLDFRCIYIASDVKKNTFEYPYNEENRRFLLNEVECGNLRKVIIRVPINVTNDGNKIKQDFETALNQLIPIYQSIYKY